MTTNTKCRCEGFPSPPCHGCYALLQQELEEARTHLKAVMPWVGTYIFAEDDVTKMTEVREAAREYLLKR